MKAVKTAYSNVNYGGPSPGIGDLWCQRLQPGVVTNTWMPSEAERKVIAEGGVVELAIFGEPIPPVSMIVKTAEDAQVVGENAYRNEFPDLPDPR